MNIEELKNLKESEAHIEFKEAKNSFQYNGANKGDPKDRRKCLLGYVTAICNEGGGRLVLGMADAIPHIVVGTNYFQGSEGQLENNIYRDSGIRVTATPLEEGGKRVLVLSIPGRPRGKILKFEDVPLMRVGDSLLPMDDQQMKRILDEQESDFTSQICRGLGLDDLEDMAIEKMKGAYAEKNNNPGFVKLTTEQALRDLDLLSDRGLTYASLILLGKESAIREYLPQASIKLEFRTNSSKIIFDKRDIFSSAYFSTLDELWDLIDARNAMIPINNGPYIFDIPLFNREVVREAINNAVAHRDYTRTSEIVIKLSPEELVIINGGGFPLGVSIDNLLTVNSTPRNFLLADVLSKTGLVERSGQGVDKIYYQCLTEGKPVPDYSQSDYFQVTLKISALIRSRSFAVFIRQEQQDRSDETKLGIDDVIALSEIEQGIDRSNLNPNVTSKLLREGLIEKRGKTKGVRFVLSKKYYIANDKNGEYSREQDFADNTTRVILLGYFDNFEVGKISDFTDLFEGKYNRNQTKYLVTKLVEQGILDKIGEGSATTYKLSDRFKVSQKILSHALEIGLDQIRKDGMFDKPKNAS